MTDRALSAIRNAIAMHEMRERVERDQDYVRRVDAFCEADTPGCLPRPHRLPRSAADEACMVVEYDTREAERNAG